MSSENMNAVNGRDVFGVKTTSRGFAIGEVLLDSAASGESGLSIRMIQDRAQASKYGKEYEVANSRKIQAVHGHIKHLFDGGFLIRVGNGLYAINLDDSSPMLARVIAEVQRRKALLTKPTATAKKVTKSAKKK